LRVVYQIYFYNASCGVIVRHGSERLARNDAKLCPFCGRLVRTRPHYPHRRRPKK